MRKSLVTVLARQDPTRHFGLASTDDPPLRSATQYPD
jgi:hypothetical protein